MKISNVPPSSYVDLVRTWLLQTLEMENLDNTSEPFPISGVQLFVNNTPMIVVNGSWLINDGRIYVGSRSSKVSNLEKLQILIAIANWARVTNQPEVSEALTRAWGREILGGFQSMFDGIVYSSKPIIRLAFAPTGQVASQFGEGDEFFLASGEPVVIDETWVQVESPAGA